MARKARRYGTKRRRATGKRSYSGYGRPRRGAGKARGQTVRIVIDQRTPNPLSLDSLAAQMLSPKTPKRAKY